MTTATPAPTPAQKQPPAPAQPQAGYEQDGAAEPGQQQRTLSRRFLDAAHGKKFALGSLLAGGTYLCDQWGNAGRATRTMFVDTGLATLFGQAGNGLWAGMYRNWESARPVLDFVTTLNKGMPQAIPALAAMAAFVLTWYTAGQMNARNDTWKGKTLGGVAGLIAIPAITMATYNTSLFYTTDHKAERYKAPAIKATQDERLKPENLKAPPGRRLILTPPGR